MDLQDQSEEDLPVWKNEITSYTSKYADDDSNEEMEEPQLHTRPVPVAKHVLDQSEVAETIMPPTNGNTSHPDIIHTLDKSVTVWIQENLSGTNLADFKVVIDPFKEHPDVYQEFLDLHNILQQLNLELLNMFDNYVCFVGPEDEAQMKRLSRLACSRAVSHLKTKNHINGPLTMKHLVEAGDKLFSYYQSENHQIAENETKLVNQVAAEILKTFETKMAAYLQEGHENIDDIHSIILQHCITLINHVLDFSAKINYVHTEKTGILENSLEEKLLELKRQHLSSQQHPKATPTVNPNPNPTPSPSNSSPPALPAKPSTSAKPIMKIAPPQVVPRTISNDTPTAPQPLNKVQAATFEYKKSLDSWWQTFGDYNRLLKFHHEIVPDYIKDLNPTEKETAVTHMNYYFAHISERFEASGVSAGKLTKCICVAFTNEGVRFGAHVDKSSDKPSGDWVFHPETSSVTTMLKFKTKKALDLLENFLVGPKEQEKNLRVDLKFIFTDLKQKASSIFGNTDHIVILAPSWLNLEHRSALKNVVQEANFKVVSFLRKSAITIYSLRNNLAPLFFVITVAVNGIYVEAYSRDSKNVIKLEGVAAHEWETQVPKVKVSGSIGRLVSWFTGKSSSNNDWKMSMRKQPNPGVILRSTYDKVFDSLGDNFKKGPIQCLLMTSSGSEIWSNAYRNLLQWRKQLVDIESFDGKLALRYAIQLSSKPQSICETIVDHPIHVGTANNFSIKNEPISLAASGISSVPKKVAPPIPNKLADLSTPKPEAIAMLKVCKQIREQLESSKMRIGVVMRRIAIETVERAELVGNDASATLDAIEAQNSKVAEIVERHKLNL